MFFSLALTFTSLVQAQTYCPRAERGDPLARRRSDIDTNNVRTSVYNFGLLGRTGAGQGVPFEWPRNTGRYYLAISAAFVGGEVIGASGDTIRIVDVPSYRTNPATGASWNFEPVPQYLNQNSTEIARGDDPSSWPPVWPDKMSDPSDPGWPGSWNGIRGKNQFINGTELYYHYSDDRYTRHRFFPDSADTNRRGLGIIVSERVLQFKGEFVDDAIFVVTDIYNVGNRPVQKAGMTLWVADFLGGDGDSQDDMATYDLDRRIVQCYDRDGVSSNPAFWGARVGSPALVFIQTPQNIGISNIQYVAAGAINFNQAPDSFFWDAFMRPGSYTNLNLIGTGEYDLFTSLSYFSLPVCTPQRVVYAWAFGADSLDSKRKAEYARSFYLGGFSSNSVQVTLSSPTVGSVVSGVVPIQWTTNPARQSLRVDIYSSTDFGDTWKAIATNEANDGSYNWNTQSLPDGIFHKLKIIAFDSLGIGYALMDSTFTINNPIAASPQVRITSPVDSLSIQSQFPVRWFAGDADGDSVTVALSYYSPSTNGWTQVAAGLPRIGTFAWDTQHLANGPDYLLSGTASSPGPWGADTVRALRILNPRYGLGDTTSVQRLTVGTGQIEARIFDTTLVNGHTYELTFSALAGNQKKYGVVDLTSGNTVVSNATQIFGGVEGPSFDGIRMFVREDETRPDTGRTRWNHSDVKKLIVNLWRESTQGIPEPADYLLVMGDVGVGRSDSVTLEGITFTARDVNFRILNTTTGTPTHFAFFERDGNDGRFSASGDFYRDYIFLLTRDSSGQLNPTWTFTLEPNSMRNPAAGDSILARFFKQFQHGDRYRFTATTGNLLNVKPSAVPAEFALEQNYPNPFNPSTSIKYKIPSTNSSLEFGNSRLGFVSLKVYDLLGREVATLADEAKEPGTYTVQWNATGFASGVYLYRLSAGGFVSTKKMLLLR